MLLAFLGGVLTIFSPCVLPVIPFVFSRADQPFRRSGLPTLIGMGFSFAIFAAAAVLGGEWVVKTNQYGRGIAVVILALAGLTLLFPSLAEKLTQPLVRLGSHLQQKTTQKSSIGTSLILGASIGLLWAPCAGPILGLVLAGAALGGATSQTFVLLLAFSAGASTSLAVALLAGGRVLRALKRNLGAEEWVRRALGVAVLFGVAAIALGLDTRFLARLSYLNTHQLEESLVEKLAGENRVTKIINEGPMPSLEGATQWLNSPPLKDSELKSKVVLIDFWTYSCINCLRSLPYIKAWADKYRDQGLVVIGVHTPEFAFEKDLDHVSKAVRDLEITYPVAVDNHSTLWRAFNNRYWPAHYFIDSQGNVRHHHFGEGDYDSSERILQKLLSEAGASISNASLVNVTARGAQAPSGASTAKSPETYLGYDRQEGFASREPLKEDQVQRYSAPPQLELNQWGLEGPWRVTPEASELQSSAGPSTTGGILFRFHARDLHLVLGAGDLKDQPIPFRVTLDGQPPGADQGEDTDENGRGEVREHRLYQLIRQKGKIEDRTFKIEFQKPGVSAFAFTFG